MPELLLSYKGFSLRLLLKSRAYYSKTSLRNGKNLYQILFERLVDGKTVSYRGIARELKEASPFIRGQAVKYAAEKIEAALKSSKDKRLQKMRFVTLPRGGASPVLERQSPRSRFTAEQREVVKATIKAMHDGGKRPTLAQIRAGCKKALGEKNLPQNVSLAPDTIRSFKKGLGLAIGMPITFTQAQRQVIGETVKAMCREENPPLSQIRAACLKALREKNLAKGAALSQPLLWRLRNRLEAGQPLWAPKRRRRR